MNETLDRLGFLFVGMALGCSMTALSVLRILLEEEYANAEEASRLRAEGEQAERRKVCLGDLHRRAEAG